MRDPVRDIVRALTVLEMEMVETADGFPHAPIEDKTISFADTLFPTFAFISGMSMVPWRRSAGLATLGIVFNATEVLGPVKPQTPRLLGVLQRHGLSLLMYNYLPQTWPTLAAVTATWLAVSIGFSATPSDPFSTPDATAQTFIDKKIFGGWLYRHDYDPEGLLGALGTYMTIFFGSWFAKSLPKCPVTETLYGLGFVSTGFLLSYLFPKFLPVSKPLWTPSFALVASGITMLKFAVVRLARPHLPPSVVRVLGYVGRNSLPIYFIGHLTRMLLCQRPLWAKTKAWLTRVLPFGDYSYICAEFLMTSAFEAGLIAFASALVRNNIKLRI